MSRLFPTLSLAVVSTALVACGTDPTPVPTGTRDVAAHPTSHAAFGKSDTDGSLVAELRAATARYHRVEAALADGYVQGSPCEVTAAGGMGEHFRRQALVDGIIDPEHPEILMYEPQKNGELRLVGVEFLIPAAAWDPTHSGPPRFAGQTFEDRRTPGSGGPPFPNYGLHIWIWQHNPSGLHAPWNPTVNCDYAP
jgi:hypothetical protein